MPTAKSIRTADAPLNYSAVIANYRRAYGSKYNVYPDELTDHEILLCWEQGWLENNSEIEDQTTLETMHEMIEAKLS